MSVLSLLKSLFIYKPSASYDEISLEKESINIEYDSRNVKEEVPPKEITANISDNFNEIQRIFSIPDNNDVIIKHFTIKRDIKCFLICYDGMSDIETIDDFIIKSMLEIPYIADECENTLVRKVISKIIPHAQTSIVNSFEAMAEEVNFGSAAIFIDGINQAIVADVRKWEHRTVAKPENEQSIYGPQEAFNEMLRTNTVLIRKILKTQKLIAEGVKLGEVSKTRGVLLYINDIANEGLVNEVKKRLNSVVIDYIISIEEVAQLIEGASFIAPTQTMSTERPDRAARALTEGRVVLLLNGSPRALVFPTNAYELTHSVSDSYLRPPYANMSRIIRYLGMLLSVLLPALYLAITLFHQEMLPTYLLYAISAARANVPFPSVVELLLMDFSFEMIREAGIRMPGPIGQTLGIVGGLILGQSAVSAKIVSPIMIVIIAITGIGSFSTPDYSLSWNFRILRLAFIILAASMGFFGIAIGIFLYMTYLASIKNFGIPFLAPLPGSDKKGYFSSLFVNSIWKREYRPSYLSTKKPKQEPKISRKWDMNRKK